MILFHERKFQIFFLVNQAQNLDYNHHIWFNKNRKRSPCANKDFLQAFKAVASLKQLLSNRQRAKVGRLLFVYLTKLILRTFILK